MQAEGVTVWGGLWSEGLIGPFFFETTVTGQNYLSMLKDHFDPQFRRLPRKDSFLFMQDGVSAHYAGDVREWLEQKFPGRWIGRRCPIEWPARSPSPSYKLEQKPYLIFSLIQIGDKKMKKRYESNIRFI